jgi:hypothetical protein
VQANEQGLHALGYDVCAFHVLLCRAKTARYALPQARREGQDFLAKVTAALAREPEPRPLGGGYPGLPPFPAAAQAYLQRWFTPRARHELLTGCRVIEKEGYACADLLRVILSRAARSARLVPHYALDLPRHPQQEPYWCYKHGRPCAPPQAALPFLRRYGADTWRRIEAFAARRTAATVRVVPADSRGAVFPPVAGVITSPPYPGLIDYHEQHAYAYHLLGLADHREREIGAAAQGTGRPARQQYHQDLVAVFRRAAAALPGGGRMVVVAPEGSSVYEAVAAQVGVEVEGRVERQIQRRTGRRAGKYGETVWIWRKP